MFKKNDPLVNAVQKIMQENAICFQAEKDLCEELGIYSKNELPNEHKANFDALLVQRINEALHPNQQKLDVHEPEKDKLTAQDFKMLRSKKTVKEEEELDENLGSGFKKFKRFYGSTGSGDPRGIKKRLKNDPAFAKDLAGRTDKVSGAAELQRRLAKKMQKPAKMDEAEEGGETREGGAVTKDGKTLVSPTAPKVEPEKTSPSASDRSALTNKIKSLVKEAKEKKKISEDNISFDSVMEEIQRKLGKAKMKKIEEEGDTHEIEFADKPGQKFKSIGKETDAPKDYNELTHDAPGKRKDDAPEAASKDTPEPGYSGEAGKTLQKAISPAKAAEDDDKEMVDTANKMNKANMASLRAGGQPKDMKRDLGTDKEGNTKYLSPVYPEKPEGGSAGPGKGGQAGYKAGRKTISQTSLEKDEDKLDEVAPPGAKYERMIKHIKDKYKKGGLTDKEKSIAYATAWKAKNK